MIKRLLIITQKVDKDDPVLGFFHRWIEEFAKYVESVHIICLCEGMHDFVSCHSGPRAGIQDSGSRIKSGMTERVFIHTLGKERGYTKTRQLLRFLNLCWKLAPQIDGVFVHMNPIYVVAGALFFRILQKPVVLWYAHRDRTNLLRIAARLAAKVLSVSPEGFRLQSPKAAFVGHGIDTDIFSPSPQPHEGFRLLAVGRISSIKNFDTLILAFDRIKDELPELTLSIAGEPIYAYDHAHLAFLKELVAKRQLEHRVIFLGSVPYGRMSALYNRHDLAVNLAPAGGVDKTVLEAMACGIPVVISNRAFHADIGEYAPRLMFQERNVTDLAKKILGMARATDRKEISTYLRKRVLERHNLEKLIPRILETYEPTKSARIPGAFL